MNPSSFIKLYVFPAEVRRYVHGTVQARSQVMGLSRIAAHAAAALAHDQQAMLLELDLRARPTALFGPTTIEHNRIMDKAISGFYRYLASQAQIHGADTPEARAANAVRAQVLPYGPRAITHRAFVEQYEIVEGILARLTQPDMQAALAELPGAERMLARLAELNAAYGASLDQEATGPTREQVRLANARGQDLLAQTVMLIFVEFLGNERDARFFQLMEPIVEQNTDIGQRYRRRRAKAARRPDGEQDQKQAEHSTASQRGQTP